VTGKALNVERLKVGRLGRREERKKQVVLKRDPIETERKLGTNRMQSASEAWAGGE
jgi:hypothetical protein